MFLMSYTVPSRLAGAVNGNTKSKWIIRREKKKKDSAVEHVRVVSPGVDSKRLRLSVGPHRKSGWHFLFGVTQGGPTLQVATGVPPQTL